jgi:hypothetical protein
MLMGLSTRIFILELGEISGSQGVEYEDACLLGCCDRPDDGGSKHL